MLAGWGQSNGSLELPRFQPEEILAVLIDEGVEFVVVGGIAATLHGSHLRTGDLDICPARDEPNLERLARAMRLLEVRIRAPGAPEGLPFDCDPSLLRTVQLLNTVTRAGDFDLTFEPAGTGGYEDLRRAAVVFDLDGLAVPTASLADVIRSKEAADRAKDREQLPTLRTLLEETERRKSER